MREVLFQLGPIKIYGYGFMIMIGVVCAFLLAEYREKKIFKTENIFDLGFVSALGGVLGSKLLFWLTELPRILENPKYILSTMSSGFVVYGGLIGGILTGFLYCKIKKLSFPRYFDLVMPSMALAQAFGRIGCFLAGCCYGRQTHAFWGVTFPESSFAPSGVSLIPTQLIFSFADFVHCGLLVFLATKLKKEGQIGGLYLIFYSIGRFLLEYLRADERGAVSFLSTSQFIAIFTLIAGILVLVVFSSNHSTDSAAD